MTAKKTTLKEIGEMLAYVVEHMATKADVRAVVRAEIGPIEARLSSIESELRDIRRELDELQEKIENLSGFRKEIDHALERIAAIEKHLGIDKKIAA